MYNFQSSKKSTWTDRKFGKISMSRDGIIGSLFDNFHYFMISESTLFLRLKNYKTWSYIPGTTVQAKIIQHFWIDLKKEYKDAYFITN